MIDLRKVINSFLLADPTISAMVGGNRIYPGILPQGITQVSVVQNLISELSDYHMLGSSGLGQSRVQLDCWAQTQNEAVVLADLILDRMSGQSGIISFGSNSPQEQATIRGMFHDQGRDDYDPVAKMHSRRRDYLIWFAQF